MMRGARNGLRMGLREIWAHKVRSCLSLMGVVLGVAALVSVVALVKGMFDGWERWIQTSGGVNKITIRAEKPPDEQKAFATKPRQEWVDLCEKWRVPGGPVNNIAEALADPQVQLRNMVIEMNHPLAGRYKTVGNPIKTGAEDKFQPPPTLGEHTGQLLEDLLGYTPEEIGELRGSGAL